MNHAAVLGVLVVLGLAAVAFYPESKKSEVEAPVFAVRRGPLTISVTEYGTIKAREQVIIKNEVEGQTTILYLIPEGTEVEEGDLLIELDSSALQDALLDQQIQVENAEAALIRAKENLAVIRNQAESDIEKAELDLRFAREDLDNYLRGEFPAAIKEAESRIALAQEELRRAEEKLKWSDVLFKEKYISQTELQADELATKKARLDLDLAVGARDLLRDFTYRRRVAELESGVKQGFLALERARRKAAADVVQAEADLRAREAEARRERGRIEKIRNQIEKTRLYAPTGGLVVYATTAEVNWRSNSEPLAEGQVVRERQDLIYLPTARSVMAEIKLHESNLDKVRAGLPVLVTAEALPGRTFSGVVASIAPLPDAQSVWLNPDLKVYDTEIHLDEDGGGLRTGMSCRAEIIVARYDDAVYAPVQAVVQTGGSPTVYVRGKQGFAPRRVEIGLDNNRMVHILGGVKPGEEVSLTPPFRAPEGAAEADHADSEADLQQERRTPSRRERQTGSAQAVKQGRP